MTANQDVLERGRFVCRRQAPTSFDSVERSQPVANRLKLHRKGAVGFIDWLDAARCRSKSISYGFFASRVLLKRKASTCVLSSKATRSKASVPVESTNSNPGITAETVPAVNLLSALRRYRI